MNALDELLLRAKHEDGELYKRAFSELYVIRHGYHYDEAAARDAVEKMESTDKDGRHHSGEHWTYEDAADVMAKYTAVLDASDTCWDVYVALNMWWHDLSSNYYKRGQHDEAIIEDAIAWAMLDEDAPEGKIWRYMHAME